MNLIRLIERESKPGEARLTNANWLAKYPQIETGDIVCVLKGLEFPTILRPQGSEYAFIGPCFVVGLMDGEAVELVRQGKKEIETFTII